MTFDRQQVVAAAHEVGLGEWAEALGREAAPIDPPDPRSR